MPKKVVPPAGVPMEVVPPEDLESLLSSHSLHLGWLQEAVVCGGPDERRKDP